MASHFPPTVKETLRVWRLRSSRSSRTSSSPALRPAIAQIRPSVSTAPALSQGVTTVVVGQDNDGQLTMTVASQPTYKLRPYHSRTFVIDELEGFRVEFHLGPDGEVDELFFDQPNGTFVAR
jgi:hypothetical protein